MQARSLGFSHIETYRTAIAAAIIALGSFGSAVAQQRITPTAEPPDQIEPARNTSEWNLHKKSALAIKGYDPVAYFPEGGSVASKGKKNITYDYKGATYRFVNANNRERFIANPARYEPAHGGWCSYAMSQEGSKTAPDPRSFIVQNDRLFLFYKGIGGNTKKSWLNADHDTQAADADRAWKRISNEELRMAPAQTDEE